jgi:hypothetical protein
MEHASQKLKLDKSIKNQDEPQSSLLISNFEDSVIPKVDHKDPLNLQESNEKKNVYAEQFTIDSFKQNLLFNKERQEKFIYMNMQKIEASLITASIQNKPVMMTTVNEFQNISSNSNLSTKNNANLSKENHTLRLQEPKQLKEKSQLKLFTSIVEDNFCSLKLKFKESDLRNCQICGIKFSKKKDHQNHLRSKGHLIKSAEMRTIQLKKDEAQKAEITSNMLKTSPVTISLMPNLNLFSSAQDINALQESNQIKKISKMNKIKTDATIITSKILNTPALKPTKEVQKLNFPKNNVISSSKDATTLNSQELNKVNSQLLTSTIDDNSSSKTKVDSSPPKDVQKSNLQ